jgi:L-ascorbate metabolism protein UlaG (beta-lactamase superfamily)
MAATTPSLLERLGRLGHRNDPSVQVQLNWGDAGDVLPAGLRLQWLGVAGFALTHGDTTVLIDPFLSRRGPAATLGSRSLRSDAALVERLVPAADAVLVGHTHFDHAVDVPTIAAAHGARVFGSASLGHLMALHGLGAQCTVVEPHRRHAVGPFTFSFTPSAHSRLLFGLAVPADGELTCDSLDHLGSGRYRCGQVWGITIEVAGVTLYHQGSANLLDDEVRTTDVDVFLCGIAGRMYTPRFLPRILGALRPRVVLAHHHDDFFAPVEAPMSFSFNVNLGGFAEDVARFDPDIAVRTLDPLQAVGGPG